LTISLEHRWFEKALQCSTAFQLVVECPNTILDDLAPTSPGNEGEKIHSKCLSSHTPLSKVGMINSVPAAHTAHMHIASQLLGELCVLLGSMGLSFHHTETPPPFKILENRFVGMANLV
jgi:hypothetical protein